jgi:hypothetical protein
MNKNCRETQTGGAESPTELHYVTDGRSSTFFVVMVT